MKVQGQEREFVAPAPDRSALDGQGPYDRLILRGVTVIDGTGAPPRGPIDVVIEGNRIVRLSGVGVPNVEIDEEERPELAIEGQPERVGGIKYTIKDGIVYDATQLMEDVRRMVEHQKQTSEQ